MPACPSPTGSARKASASRSRWPGSMAAASTSRPARSAGMRERKAFGKRLDEFQALQFRLADMATELEAARTFVWRAAAALDRKDSDATMLCAMAKRFGP